MVWLENFHAWLISVPAPFGWFMGAFLSGLLTFGFGQLTERLRQKRSARGTKRQIQTLLRAAMKTMEPFFYSFKALHFGDVCHTWDRCSERLRDKDTVLALSDTEYAAFDQFVEVFGVKIAVAQGIDRDRTATQSDQELRLFLAQSFQGAVEQLAESVRLIGDDSLAAQYRELQGKVERFFATADARLQR